LCPVRPQQERNERSLADRPTAYGSRPFAGTTAACGNSCTPHKTLSRPLHPTKKAGVAAGFSLIRYRED
jgi:hypothetical protein